MNFHYSKINHLLPESITQFRLRVTSFTHFSLRGTICICFYGALDYIETLLADKI